MNKIQDVFDCYHSLNKIIKATGYKTAVCQTALNYQNLLVKHVMERTGAREGSIRYELEHYSALMQKREYGNWSEITKAMLREEETIRARYRRYKKERRFKTSGGKGV